MSDIFIDILSWPYYIVLYSTIMFVTSQRSIAIPLLYPLSPLSFLSHSIIPPYTPTYQALSSSVSPLPLEPDGEMRQLHRRKHFYSRA